MKLEHIVENNSKQDKAGATFVWQEIFMGYQTTSCSAWLLVSLISPSVQVYVMHLSLDFQTFSAVGPNILHSELVEVKMISKL